MRKLLIALLLLSAVAAAFFATRGDGHDLAERTVRASSETKPVPSKGDAADDPAIWVNPRDPARSLIVGTDKRKGLAVYDLAGAQLQFVSVGRMNNVDLRTGVRAGGREITLVAASDDEANDVMLLELAEEPPYLRVLPGKDASFVSECDAEGICLYRSPRDGELYVFVVGRARTARNVEKARIAAGETRPVEEPKSKWSVDQWRLRFDSNGLPLPAKMRTIAIEHVSEGCAADDENGWLFVSDERHGIYRFSAEPDGGDEAKLVCAVVGSNPLNDDVEGIALLKTGPKTGYLIASSQGSDDFVVLRREGDQEYLGRFRVGRRNGDLDGVTHTDGLDAAVGPLPPPYDQGLIVVQDDENNHGDNQNFKLVAWKDVAAALDLR